ncbi:MAG TPA: PAS domain S-box protein, partial [Candidatus Aquilonibacter sp.]|nr:PAS domain S-box protein [Candidatus Aquilonibacter sp.]
MSRAYAQLLLGIADAIVATDSQGRIVLWNDTAETMFGFAREHVLGTDVRALVPERFAAQFDEQFRSTLAGGATSTSRLIAIVNTADGDTKRVEAAISVVPFEDEPIIVSVVRDAGNSERQLREAEELAGMGSFQWNVGSDEIIWSDNLARIYGYEPGAHPTTLAAFIERVHPDDRDAVQKQIGRALDEGASWSMEERIIRADTGETRILAS